MNVRIWHAGVCINVYDEKHPAIPTIAGIILIDWLRGLCFCFANDSQLVSEYVVAGIFVNGLFKLPQCRSFKFNLSVITKGEKLLIPSGP